MPLVNGHFKDGENSQAGVLSGISLALMGPRQAHVVVKSEVVEVVDVVEENKFSVLSK